MYGVKIRQSELPWTAVPGMAGVWMKTLYKDPASGAQAVLTRIDAGAEIPAHWHTRADETVYVLAGDFVEDDVRYGPGAFFAARAGVPHGPHRSAGGCIVLTHFSAELDFQLV